MALLIDQNQARNETRRNWAGNYSYSANRVCYPAGVEAVQALVRESRQVKALGSRHSFNDIADSSGVQISPDRLQSITIDPSNRTVAVGAGVRYGDLVPQLHAAGFALHNLASLPHISIAGSIATATHGSGVRCGNLATAVSSLEFVRGTGELMRLSRRTDGDRFNGAVVGLGALGIVTQVTLDLSPAYDVAQTVYLDLPFSILEKQLLDVFSAGYSVSLFTDWRGSRATQVWIKRRTDHSYASQFRDDFYGAIPATINVHPIAGHDPAACTEQLGIPGPWYDRLPHFRMSHTPSSGRELQSEYFVPLENGYEAIRAIEALRDAITPYLYITELRTIAADQFWMSMAYERSSLAIHFTWKPGWDAVRHILPKIEERLEPFGARPHWGKLFTLTGSQVVARYRRLEDFRGLMAEFDPEGKFQNGFIRRYLVPSHGYVPESSISNI